LGGNVFTREIFLLTAAAAFLAAAAGPLWGPEWGSWTLAFWSAFLLALLSAGLWRVLRPGRRYPSADFGFIIPLILSINLFVTLMAPDGHVVKPLNYLLVVLCALFYPLRFNLGVAGLILALEAANLLLSPARGEARPFVNLAVYGASLFVTALVMSRLFQAEHRKKEKAVQEIRRLREGAEDASMGSISPVGRMSRLMDSDALLDKALGDLLDTARAAVPCDNAVFFMAGGDGEGAYVRVSRGSGAVSEGSAITPGQGLVGWVLKDKKPILVADNVRGLGYLKKEDGVRSFLGVPVLNGGSLEGVIALDSSIEGMFDESARETLTGIAGIAVYLMQNIREYHQADLSAKNFEALHRISSDISASLDLKDILEKLAGFARDIVPYDYLTISFLDGDGAATFRVLKGYDGVKLPAGPAPLAGSLLGWIAENRQALSFTDMDRSTEGLPVFPVKELQTDCRSFLGLPFNNRGKVLGIMTLALRQKEAISGYQQHMMSIVANQVAVNLANAQLHHVVRQMATTDGLTGLINHRHFQDKADEKFARAVRYPEPISILLFDIDHFKKVNDTYGHPVGDAVLKNVSVILREAVRAVDIAARYGGEEFVVLLDNTDEAGALLMAERIRETIAHTRLEFEGKVVPVTISVGCATYPADGVEKKVLIEKADQALYFAKDSGRNRTCAWSAVSAAKP